MKPNKDLIMRKVAGEVVLIPTGKMAQEYNGMITMNPVAVFIWENIEKTENIDQMVDMIMNEFEIDSVSEVSFQAGLQLLSFLPITLPVYQFSHQLRRKENDNSICFDRFAGQYVH